MFKIKRQQAAGANCSAMEQKPFQKRVQLKNQRSRRHFLFLIIAIIMFSSCAQIHLYTAYTVPKRDEISMSPDLRQFIDKNKNKQISVVLRVPHTTSTITKEVLNDEFYNVIEQKLVNAGFAVRDRALLEKLIITEQASYESIGKKIKADIIIELVENTEQNNTQTKIFRKKDNKEMNVYGGTMSFMLGFFQTRELDNGINITMSKITFRIVLVETGASSGFFTFYYTPCTDGCDFYIGKYGKAYFFDYTKTGAKRKRAGWLPLAWQGCCSWYVSYDFIIEDLPNRIIDILKGRN